MYRCGHTRGRMPGVNWTKVREGSKDSEASNCKPLLNERPSNSDTFDPSLIRDVRAVVLSSPKGVPISEFPSDFKKLTGYFFPHQRHGHANPLSLLRALEKEDVVRLQPDKKEGCWRVYGVCDDSYFMPSWVKKAAYKTEKQSGNDDQIGEPEITQKAQSKGKYRELMYDSQGQVSVFVCWNKRKGSVSNDKPQDKVEVLKRMMSRAGQPLEIHVQNKNYGFVRFQLLEEAQKAIDMYNRKVVNGLLYTVKPADPLIKEQTTKQKPILVKVGASSCKEKGEELAICLPKSADNHVTAEEEEWSNSSDNDVWDESLLPGSFLFDKAFPFMDNDHIWSQLLTDCSGDLSLEERLCQSNNNIKITSYVSICHCWIQLPESPLVQCYKAIESYLKTLTLSPLRQPPQVGKVYGLQGMVPARCYILSEKDNGTHRVLLLDSGEIVNVSCDQFMLLPSFAAVYPMLALPCLVHGLELHQERQSYYDLREGSAIFAGVTKGQVLDANVQPYSDKNPFPLLLQLSNQDIIQELSHSSLTTPMYNYKHSDQKDDSTFSTSSSNCHILDDELDTNNSSDSIISHCNIPNDNGLTPAYISEVVSPGLFWVQVTQRPSEDLSCISHQLQMECAHLPPKTQVCQGDLYALLNEEMALRVRVQSILSETQVIVLCVDKGCTMTIPIRSLYTLPSSLLLSSVPALALPCSMYGVVSTREDDQWWSLDNQLLWKLIRCKIVYVKFMASPVTTSIDALHHIPTDVYLDEDGWDNVAELLIQEGHYIDFDPVVKGLKNS